MGVCLPVSQYNLFRRNPHCTCVARPCPCACKPVQATTVQCNLLHLATATQQALIGLQASLPSPTVASDRSRRHLSQTKLATHMACEHTPTSSSPLRCCQTVQSGKPDFDSSPAHLACCKHGHCDLHFFTGAIMPCSVQAKRLPTRASHSELQQHTSLMASLGNMRAPSASLLMLTPHLLRLQSPRSPPLLASPSSVRSL